MKAKRHIPAVLQFRRSINLEHPGYNCFMEGFSDISGYVYLPTYSLPWSEL